MRWYPIVFASEVVFFKDRDLKCHTKYKKYNAKAKAKNDFKA